MKEPKFSEEQIAYALRQADGGTAADDVWRPVGISEATFHLWEQKYVHSGENELWCAARGDLEILRPLD